MPTRATVNRTLFFMRGLTVNKNVIAASKRPTPVPILNWTVDGAYSRLPNKMIKLVTVTNMAKSVETQRKVTNERKFLTPTQLFRATQ